MRVLLTNDDGYEAPGLPALWEAIDLLGGVQIDVVAPLTVQSGKGHSITYNLRCRRAQLERIGPVLVVEGTPADCVRAALAWPGRPRPDWVLAGINRGSNLGVDVYYSGTVAAAREAAMHGIPALAVSQLVNRPPPDDWSSATRLAAAVIAAVLKPAEPPPPRIDRDVYTQVSRALDDYRRQAGQTPLFWNINLPLDNGRPPAAVVVPVSTDPLPPEYRHRTDEQGIEHLEDAGGYHRRPYSPGTDVALAFAGAITISPMTF